MEVNVIQFRRFRYVVIKMDHLEGVLPRCIPKEVPFSIFNEIPAIRG